MIRNNRILLLFLAGCGGGTSAEPDLRLDDLPTTLTFSVGVERRVGDVVVRFAEVKNDSRCPRDVQCVHAGNAEVLFEVRPVAGDGPAVTLALNTSRDPRAGSGLGLTVTLVTLAPYPVSTSPTRDYRAEVTIGRAAAGSAAAGTDFLVSVRDGKAFAPDSVGAGWIRVRVEEDGKGHLLVAYRLPAAVEADDFLRALDTAAMVTPAGAVAIGGTEVGDTGDVILELKPGRHVIGCLRRNEDGHRHATTGEAKAFVVTGQPAPGRESPPGATAELGLVDFAFTGADRWSRGTQLLRVANTGTQDHHLRIDRLHEGVTMERWLKNEDAVQLSDAIVGVARMAPGTVAYLPMDLLPGRYIVYCLVPHPASHRPHVEMGMLREIRVD